MAVTLCQWWEYYHECKLDQLNILWFNLPLSKLYIAEMLRPKLWCLCNCVPMKGQIGVLYSGELIAICNSFFCGCVIYLLFRPYLMQSCPLLLVSCDLENTGQNTVFCIFLVENVSILLYGFVRHTCRKHLNSVYIISESWYDWIKDNSWSSACLRFILTAMLKVFKNKKCSFNLPWT